MRHFWGLFVQLDKRSRLVIWLSFCEVFFLRLVVKWQTHVNDRQFAWIEAQRALQKLSGITIPQNALRHSFGTYHRQRGKDTARTAFEMGNSPAVVERNYADAVSDSEALAFWAL